MNVSQVLANLNSIFYENADSRIRDKLFMGTPWMFSLTYVCYVLLITYILPKLTANRKSSINFYKVYGYLDAFLLMLALYFLSWGIYAWFFHYNWLCQPLDRESSDGVLAVEICYQFLMAKYFYMLQNVVYSLAKKEGPVPKYILWHHVMIGFVIWGEINYYPGGHVRKSTF